MHVGIGKCARWSRLGKSEARNGAYFIFPRILRARAGKVENMSHNVAGIDVHKKLLVVVLADTAKPAVALQSRKFGTGAAELRQLSEWLLQNSVTEAVMESTAQYWKPVWMELEPYLELHLAQAQSNKAPKGRKSDL